jgi:hypothetical protein
VAIVKNFLRALVSQDGAVANARAAATTLSGRRVQREEVELFLERLEDSRARVLRAGVSNLRVSATGEVAPR